MVSAPLRASLAATAAAALLTTSTGGYTAWQQAHSATPPGRLDLQAGPTEVLVGADPKKTTPVDASAGVHAVAGETVTVRLPVAIRTGGRGEGVLTVDVPAPGGDAALVAELRANPTPVRVIPADGGPDLPAVAGRPASLSVPADADGHTYVVEWSTSTRATRDGRAPGKRNLRGSGPASLQGLSVGTRPLTVTLDSASARAVVPAIRMGTTALSVTAGKGDAVLTGLGTRPLAVTPTGVTLAPGTLLDRKGLPGFLTAARIGADVGWGEADCTPTRWSVPAGGFDARGVGRPAAKGAAAETLPAGASRRVCARLTSGLRTDELVQRFAGRAVTARTQWTSRLTTTPTWSTTTTTDSVLRVPLPAPVAPARGACVAAKGAVTLSWAWPAAGSVPVKDAKGIARWTVRVRPQGEKEWTTLVDLPRAADRSVRLSGKALRAARLAPGAYDVAVRATPSATADSPHADSGPLWGLRLGKGGATCAPAGASAARTPDAAGDVGVTP